MSDLDAELKKLVMRHGWITESDNWQEAVQDIKHAFAENGVSFIPETEVLERVKKYDDQIVCSLCQNRFTSQEDYNLHAQLHIPTMTGQDWYDKFIETLEPSGTTAVFVDGSTPNNFTITWNIVNRAAKLAAGIEGTDDI